MRLAARLAAVFVAALAWSTVAVLVAEWSGLLAPRSSALAAGPVDDDPCALRLGLPVGDDGRCAFSLAEDGGPPLAVELRQTWTSLKPPVLAQHLRVSEAGAASPLADVAAQTASTRSPRRILRLAVVPAGAEEHLVYLVGECGGLACGRNDLVITRWVRARTEELLRRPLGALAEIELAPGRVTVLEGTGRVIGQRLDPRVERTFTWTGDRYVESAFRAVATPTPSPR